MKDRKWPRSENMIAAAKARFIHCLNLVTLFEFAIPVIQDYGTAIKLNSVDRFMHCFHKLLLLLIMFHTRKQHVFKIDADISWSLAILV